MTPQEIKLFRKGIGWTQQQLADNLDVTRGHITNCEAGVAELKQAYSEKLRCMAILHHISLVCDDD